MKHIWRENGRYYGLAEDGTIYVREPNSTSQYYIWVKDNHVLLPRDDQPLVHVVDTAVHVDVEKQKAPKPTLLQKPVVYLAGPYTHVDYHIRLKRYRMLTQAAAVLMRNGCIVYSPITYTHILDSQYTQMGLSMSHEEWLEFDRPFMEMCESLYILKLDGWTESTGIAREIEYFTSKQRQIIYLPPEFIHST